jgi:hypothetical protein
MDLNAWTHVVANLGMPAVIVGVLMYVVVRYAPQVVAAHLDFVATAKNQLERILILQQDQLRVIEAVGADAGSRQHLSRALRHLAEAAQEYVRGTGKEAAVAPHLAAILEACDE